MRALSFAQKLVGPMCLAWCVTLSACVGRAETTPTMKPSGAMQTTAPTPPIDAAVFLASDAQAPKAAPVTAATPTSRSCKVDPEAERACLARGSDFSYGPTPFIYCSGVAANTGALAEQHARAQQNAPCTCYDQRAMERQRASCSMVPSAPGGR